MRLCLYLLVLLICLLPSHAYVLGNDYGFDRTLINDCIDSIPENDFTGLKRLYFSKAESYEISRTCNDGMCAISGATGLYYPWQKRIVIYNNDDFCLILKHELCHHKQNMEGKPLDEEECNHVTM